MKTTVLVVEDEQNTAELLKCVLERTGFLVTHAKDGRQATTLIETTRAPSLVLIDSPAFTGGVLSEFKLRLSRVFLPLASNIPPDNLFCNPNRGHKVPG
jgi:response regulator RpfG family c-di-GMP phosphodiesterase